MHAAVAACHLFPGATYGAGQTWSGVVPGGYAACCARCSATAGCVAWTWHEAGDLCFLKDNSNAEQPPRPVDPRNRTMSGLTAVAPTCSRGALCPEGYPCPACDSPVCSCFVPADRRSPFGCLPPHDHYPFCDVALPVAARVRDLLSRIDDAVKPNLMTARGRGGSGQQLQALPELGVPGYYWGTNCLHSLNGGSCVRDPASNSTRCPTNFPSGPSFAATFDRGLIRRMAAAIGVELRAMVALGVGKPSLDCWGPVVNLNRDPRWGRNGEGGAEDAYLMGELASQWTQGFQAPRSSLNASRKEPLLQGVITLKHMAVNSLENTFPFTRHSFDANATFGVSPFVLSDYYLRPFRAAIKDGGARGIMCSYNAVLGKPTCLSPLMRNARAAWGFAGYVTSDSDSVHDAYDAHRYPPPHPTAIKATALALRDGQCDVNSGDTYNDNLLLAVALRSEGLEMSDVDRALFNAFKQRFDLGLMDPKASYAWPTAADVGSPQSAALSLRASQESIVLLRNDAGLLPVRPGRRIAVVGPHAFARKVLVQPYPFSPFCPDNTEDCLVTPFEAIAALNPNASSDAAWTRAAQGCDLFLPSKAGFGAALALAREADVVVLGLGIETCGMDPTHNLNPHAHGGKKGTCFQEKMTPGYVFPDAYLELEAHDRTTIDLPPIQHEFAAAILALRKPTVIFLMNAGAVAIDAEVAAASAPLAVIEAFYPGPHGGSALAQGIMGTMNAWGRLPYTIYRSNWTAAAAMTEHDLRVPPGRTYRYAAPEDVLFPFGAGLSLSRFELAGQAPACLAQLRTTAPDEPCAVTVTVDNVGGLDGDAVVLAYFQVARSAAEWARRRGNGGRDPRGNRLLQPQKQLFDFARVRDIKAGSRAAITFQITAAALAEVDEATGDLVSEPGRAVLMFDDGSGDPPLQMAAQTAGARRVLEPFPADE